LSFLSKMLGYFIELEDVVETWPELLVTGAIFNTFLFVSNCALQVITAKRKNKLK